MVECSCIKTICQGWNNIAFLQLHLLEGECKKELVSLAAKQRLTSAVNWKAFVIVTRLSAWPVNFTAKVVSNLQSKLHAKNLKKTRRDSNDSTMHYPTDFPIYVQIVDALDSQRGRGLTIERNQFDHACPHQPESRNTVRKSTSPANYIDWRQLSKRHKSAKTYKNTTFRPCPH